MHVVVQEPGRLDWVLAHMEEEIVSVPLSGPPKRGTASVLSRTREEGAQERLSPVG